MASAFLTFVLEQLISVLSRYEEKSMQFQKEFVTSHSSGEKSDVSILKEEVDQTYVSASGSGSWVDKLKNPYMNIFYWVKGEINDVIAFQQAIQYRLGPCVQQ